MQDAKGILNRDKEIKKKKKKTRRCLPNRRKKKYEFADHVEMYNSRNVIIIKVDHTKADMRETYVRKRKRRQRESEEKIKKE